MSITLLFYIIKNPIPFIIRSRFSVPEGMTKNEVQIASVVIFTILLIMFVLPRLYRKLKPNEITREQNDLVKENNSSENTK